MRRTRVRPLMATAGASAASAPAMRVALTGAASPPPTLVQVTGAAPALRLAPVMVMVVAVAVAVVVAVAGIGVPLARADGSPDSIAAALDRAGANRAQIQRALDSVRGEEREGMEFLIAHMPEPDLRTLTADFLVENVELAYDTWRETPWQRNVPHEVFLEAVLPYAVIDERRDSWRRELRHRCLSLIEDATRPADAGAALNRELFPLAGVRYDVSRSKNNQSAREVLAEQKATCTGLSILLIDACRSVGVPARFVGTPLWPDSSGNHSWVEIWDDGWHYTGAAEPTGDHLDEAWFTDRAATAIRDVPDHAIYAVNYSRTPTLFPKNWPGAVDELQAINVTDRYTSGWSTDAFDPPEGMARVEIVVREHPEGKRVAVEIEVRDETGAVCFTGETKPSTADMRDHLSVFLPRDREYRVLTRLLGMSAESRVRTDSDRALCTLYLRDPDPGAAGHGWGRPFSPR